MNTQVKHTPGPWIVNEEGRMVEAQLPNLRNEYEHICDFRGGIRGQINAANAHLIAAAPAMYEALKAALDYYRGVFTGNAVTDKMMLSKLAQALAQAEGK